MQIIIYQLDSQLSLPQTLRGLRFDGITLGKNMEGDFVIPVWSDLAISLFPIVERWPQPDGHSVRIRLGEPQYTDIINYNCKTRGGEYLDNRQATFAL